MLQQWGCLYRVGMGTGVCWGSCCFRAAAQQSILRAKSKGSESSPRAHQSSAPQL